MGMCITDILGNLGYRTSLIGLSKQKHQATESKKFLNVQVDGCALHSQNCSKKKKFY